MHAVFIQGEEDIVNFVKRAANDPSRTIKFRVPLPDLRLVADEMTDVFTYGMSLFRWLIDRNMPPRSISRLGLGLGRGPLPQKPQRPRKLNSYQPEAVRPDTPLPPQSSGA